MAGMKKKRNYEKEYRSYQGTPEQIKKRAQRNAARAKMVKAGLAYKGDGRDIDHKMGLAAGNGRSNLRSISKHKNRSYDRRGPGGKQVRRGR